MLKNQVLTKNNLIYGEISKITEIFAIFLMAFYQKLFL